MPTRGRDGLLEGKKRRFPGVVRVLSAWKSHLLGVLCDMFHRCRMARRRVSMRWLPRDCHFVRQRMSHAVAWMSHEMSHRMSHLAGGCR